MSLTIFSAIGRPAAALSTGSCPVVFHAVAIGGLTMSAPARARLDRRTAAGVGGHRDRGAPQHSRPPEATTRGSAARRRGAVLRSVTGCSP